VANITIVFGILLILLGLGGWFGSGGASMTALIPAAFGIVLLILGVIARNEKVRKHAMHVAVIVGLLGFFGSASGLLSLPAVLSGEPVERPAAVISKSIMAVLSLLYVARCVKSFIDARRNRATA
jgi:hypothetical protein